MRLMSMIVAILFFIIFSEFEASAWQIAVFGSNGAVYKISEKETFEAKLKLKFEDMFQQVLAVDTVNRNVFVEESPRLGPSSVGVYDLDSYELKKYIISNVELSSSEIVNKPISIKISPGNSKVAIIINEYNNDKDIFLHDIKMFDSKTLNEEKRVTINSQYVTYYSMINESDLLFVESTDIGNDDEIKVINLLDGIITKSFKPYTINPSNYISSGVEDFCKNNLLIFVTEKTDEVYSQNLYKINMVDFSVLSKFKRGEFYRARLIDCNNKVLIQNYDEQQVRGNLEIIDLAQGKNIGEIAVSKSIDAEIFEISKDHQLALYNEIVKSDSVEINKLNLVDLNGYRIIGSYEFPQICKAVFLEN